MSGLAAGPARVVADPSVLELAIDQAPFAGGEPTVSRRRVVGRTLTAVAQAELPETRRHGEIGAAEAHGQDARTESGVQAQQLVLRDGPAGPGSRWRRRVAGRQSEPPAALADGFGRSADRPCDLGGGARRSQVPQPRGLERRPSAAIGREPQLASARGDCFGGASREPGGDIPACEAVRVAVSDGDVLGGDPSPTARRAMQAERVGTDPQGVRASSESLRELGEGRAGDPAVAQQRVVVDGVWASAGPGDVQTATSRANLLHRSMEAARQGCGRQLRLDRGAEELVL